MIAARPRTPIRVGLLGATGTIGRATLATLMRRGHDVVCLARSCPSGALAVGGPEIRVVDVCNPVSIARDGFRGERFDAVVSCMASRTGTPRDAWAIDHQAHVNVLAAASRLGVGHFVLLSAICVQKPLLGFQHAKLAFETALIESGLMFSIVRPTAFFKSLSGQVERVKRGKSFLVFGDGTLSAAARLAPALSEKAELARIGRYYATESMLVLNPETGRYDAAATPSAETETLFEFYKKLVDGDAAAERGDHAVF
jgi:divinyl chlorophyllide a 8-vinyl-reductase